MPEQLLNLMQTPSPHAKHVLIIGAGLAGACSAYALAQQGWQVLVLDAAAQAAQGASALPVGLMATRKGGVLLPTPQDEPDWDGQGMACTRRWLENFTQQKLLQQGLDWQACGTAHSTQWQKNTENAAEQNAWLWQDDACWIKPQRLVAACLAHPAITCVWQVTVTHIAPHNGAWQVQASDGRAWQAAAVVLAASVGSQALLQSMPQGAVRSPLWRVQNKQILIAAAGQVIYAPWQAGWNALLPMAAHAPHACNGHGHFVPAVPAVAAEGGQDFWFSGATYVHEADAQAANTDADEAENLARLHALLPSFSPVLAAQKQAGQIQRFVGVRCTTPTRLPVVQELQPSLWLCTGFGSRGLSHAPLAAKCLAENMARP